MLFENTRYSGRKVLRIRVAESEPESES